MIYPDLEMEIPESLGKVHFVGIGGAGMSAIAHMMHAVGVEVTGSDRSANYSTAALEAKGIRVSIGQDAAHVGDADTLVITGALSPDNPEYLYAIEHGLPVLHRSQALAWLGRGKRLIAVAGAHGKTTSTGMLVMGLLELGADPSFVNGSVIEPVGVSSAPGEGELFAIEADESDKSFLIYDAQVALITNVDPEHLDFYGSRENFMRAFVDFARGASEMLVISSDDPGAREVRAELQAEGSSPPIRTFGFADDADVRLVSVDTTGPALIEVEVAGKRYRQQLEVFGRYNAVNAAGAVAVLTGLGWGAAESLRAVATFGGTKRRFEFHGEIGGVRVFDDYAHHPTEVAALLESARAVAGEGKLLVVHQPHLFSRTKTFYREFAEAFEAFADHTVVLDIDPVREAPDPTTTGALVAFAFADSARASYIDDWQVACDFVADRAVPGDVIVVVGAGSVYKIVPDVLAALTARTEAA